MAALKASREGCSFDKALGQVALRFVLNVGGGDAVSPHALEAFKDFGEYGEFEPPGLFDVACVERPFDSLFTDYLLNIGRNGNADIPTEAAATLAAPTFKIGVVCQRDGTHKWHPLPNIRPQYVFEK
jgi:hypothetical protein